MLKNFFKKLLGFEELDKRIRILERKNYWREKYKHGISKFKLTSNIL
jgi:hypothetical protein|tara:strand:+ start:82 stop:222 length:141 start_codon:yes stop_codon:yes gene_type:complete